MTETISEGSGSNDPEAPSNDIERGVQMNSNLPHLQERRRREYILFQLRQASPFFVLSAAGIAVIGHVVFCFLLLEKWESLEPGNGLALDATKPVHTGRPVGPAWSTVLAPLWVADGVVMLISALQLKIGADPSCNQLLLHVNGIIQKGLQALCKVLLMQRLETEKGAFTVVFAPMYAALFCSVVLHYSQEPVNGKRPGYPCGIGHLLALTVSFKLDGVFGFDQYAWRDVLWPLWLMYAALGGLVVLFLCCGLPIVMMGGMGLAGHYTMKLFVVLVYGFLVAWVLPSFVAALRLAWWLDGDMRFTIRKILRPYISSILIAVVFLQFWFVWVLYSRTWVQQQGSEGEESMVDLAAIVAQHGKPRALVRESGTLFRRASQATLDKFLQRRSSRDGARDGQEGQEGCVMVGQAYPSSGSKLLGSGPRSEHLIHLHAHDAPSVFIQPTHAGTEAATLIQAWVRGQAARRSTLQHRKAMGIAAPASAEELMDETRCWICWTDPRDAVFMECGHGGICYSCAVKCLRKANRMCPMCRQQIDQVVRLSPIEENVEGNIIVEVQ